jgi:serine/threonine-protein kinase
MSASYEPPASGTILAGKYRVDHVLGAGGMGVVVAAYHTQLERKVALKFLLPTALENTESVARFLQEGRAVSQLRSEHVAKVIDVGSLENGSPYMVMELLDGTDLSAVFEASKRDGLLPIEVLVDYILQAIDAIAEAHVLQIVHRDLKPANLFLSRGPDGTESIKVLDFGISKKLDQDNVALTTTKAVMGSPLYMSPEQFRSAKNVDSRADIWSLGVIAYEGLTGISPFIAETLGEVCARVLEATPESIVAIRDDVPPELEAAIFRCLRRPLDERFANVAELARALAPFGSGDAQRSVDRAVRLLQGLSSPRVAPPSGSTRIRAGSSPSLPGGTASPRLSAPEIKVPSSPDLGVANTVPHATWDSLNPGAAKKRPIKFFALGLVATLVTGAMFALRAVPHHDEKLPSTVEVTRPTSPNPSETSEPTPPKVNATTPQAPVAPLAPSASGSSADDSSLPKIASPKPTSPTIASASSMRRPPAQAVSAKPAISAPTSAPPPTSKPDILDTR